MKQMSDLLVLTRPTKVCAEAHASAIHTVLNDFLQPLEGSAADEQNIGRIYLYQFLMGMLSSA